MSTPHNRGMKDLLKRLYASETNAYQSYLLTLMDGMMKGKVKDAEVVLAARKANRHYIMARGFEHALNVQHEKELPEPADVPEPPNLRPVLSPMDDGKAA